MAKKAKATKAPQAPAAKKATAKKSVKKAAHKGPKKPPKPVGPLGPNDHISQALNKFVPENLAGTDRFLDIVNWNIRYFNELDPARIELIAQIMTEINADIFVLQEIADGALNTVAERLRSAAAGLYKVAYGRTGGEQRVAFLYDTEWVRAKDDFGELFSDEPNVLPGTRKRIFPRLPFHGLFEGRSEDGRLDFHLTGVHLKAYMGPEDDGVEQRRLSARRIAQWVQEVEDERDILVVGDWNKVPSAPEWKVLRDLEKAGHVRFHEWNHEDEGSHFYRSATPTRIDIVMVSDEITKVAVEQEAKVIPWKNVFTSAALRKELIKTISDHMPVISRFYFRDDD